MKKHLILLPLILLLFSCGRNEEKQTNPVEDSLNMVNNDLQGQVIEKDSAIASFLSSFNEIQENLDQIKEKEKIISVKTKDAELQKSEKEKIVEGIQEIYDLMTKNKKALASMSKKLKSANVKIAELEKTIERLTAQLTEKDTEITALKDKLEKLNVELTALTANYQESVKESEGKTDQLNTAFYVFGTSKELITQGVLTKEGGFVGIGKIAKLKADFNKDYFTKIDITQTTSITLGSKKAKLITSHPSGSYKFEGEEGKKVEKLNITNPQEFWGTSKYLVIVVE